NDFFSKEFKSSFGEKEKRFCVKTTIKIGKKKIKSSVSLTDRSDMKFQVLIGRKTLLRKFVVDVSKKFA
ncbi:MAG: RimK/LysX family protein, partial [Flavobacteriales bacterium]